MRLTGTPPRNGITEALWHEHLLWLLCAIITRALVICRDMNFVVAPCTASGIQARGHRALRELTHAQLLQRAEHEAGLTASHRHVKRAKRRAVEVLTWHRVTRRGGSSGASARALRQLTERRLACSLRSNDTRIFEITKLANADCTVRKPRDNIECSTHGSDHPPQRGHVHVSSALQL
jgi:hypothetical protein